VSLFAQTLRRFCYSVLAMPKSFLAAARVIQKPKLSTIHTSELRQLPAVQTSTGRLSCAVPNLVATPQTKERLCLECEQPIPAKRLAAVPQTRYCVDCAPHWHEPYIATISDDDSGCYNIVLSTRDPTSLEDAVLHRRYTP
jgi:hypothetical protein